MFNKTYNLSPKIEFDGEVHVHRAPTDASVALLKEMEKAAKDKLLDSIPIGNTNLDIQLLIEQNNFNDCFSCALLMKINGERHKAKLTFPEDLRWMSLDERIEAIKKSASEAVAVLFFQELTRKPEQQAALKMLFGQKK